jgi:hypothetical protein
MGETVSIGCKLPNGHIIELGQVIVSNEASDRRDLAMNIVQDGTAVRLNGSSHPNAVGGYGITAGIDKDQALEWFERNKDFPPVKNGFIIMHDDGRTLRGEAKERADEKTGLEPLDPENPLGDGSIKPEKETQQTIEKNKAAQGQPAAKE